VDDECKGEVFDTLKVFDKNGLHTSFCDIFKEVVAIKTFPSQGNEE